jgi:hypothetical protein
MLGIIRVLEQMLDGTAVNGEHNKVAILDHIVGRFESTALPVFLTLEQWRQWVEYHVQTFQFAPPLIQTAKRNWNASFIQAFQAPPPCSILTDEQRQDIIRALSNYCEASLLTLNKIMMLKEEVNGFKVVTNPSVLSTEILGDLLWWFHKYGRGEDGVADIQSLRLNQENILQKLKVVDQERKTGGQSVDSAKTEQTAMDHLNALGKGLHSLSLVELLNKMGVGLQIYNEHTKEMESWLLGLAPDFPKGKRELNFDW